MSTPNYGFDLERITLPLSMILPVRQLKDPEKSVVRYKTILASIKEVGIIEPLMVYPQKGKDNPYLLMDGHLRFYALRELGIGEVECLISTEDESFTYNARISRVSPIQEHKMVAKAVKNGVSVARIAAALNMDVRDIKARMNLLNGIHEEAVDLLKDKDICPAALRILKRVSSVRQIEIAEMMVDMNNFSKGYAEGLFLGTSKDQLVNPEKPKTTVLSAEEIARMEQEMESLERDFKAIEADYSDNMLNLTVIRGYVKKLLDNGRIVRFLGSKHQDIYTEFDRVAATEAL